MPSLQPTYPLYLANEAQQPNHRRAAHGGVKDAGLRREGVRFAMEDMTEIRNLVIRTPEGKRSPSAPTP